MSQAIECRICHKGDTLGPRGVMLTCGQCKRHTHHSCLVPRMTNQHLVALLDTLKNPGAPQFGHPEVWMCPRCFGRNPEAAMKTILGRRFFKSTNSSAGSSPTQQAQAGPSRPQRASLPAARNSVRSTSEQATSSAISVDDDDVEIIDSTASTPQRSVTLSTGRSSSRLSMTMDVDDDDIQIVEGPPPSRSASLSSSRQTSRALSQTNMPPPSRSQSIISRAESMSGMYTSQSPAPLPSRPGISVLRSTSLSTFSGTPVPRHTVNGSVRPHHPLPSRPTFAMGMEPPISQRPIASSSRHGLWTDLLGRKNANTSSTKNSLPIPRKRRQPSNSRARSESSDGPSDDPDFPEKRPRTDNDRGQDAAESDRRLAPTVTTEDIRRIQAELRAQGKLAPPPTNYYTNRVESRQWWSTSAGANSGSRSMAVSREEPVGSTSQSRPRSAVSKPVSDDDSELEVTDGPRKLSSADRPVQEQVRARPPLFAPDSEESEDESHLRFHNPQKVGIDVKGKGKARASSIDDDIKEEEQVEVKLEALDSLNLGGNHRKSRKRSPDISERLPLHQWKANQKTMDGEDEPEDLKMLSNDKFRIVEKQESGRMGPRKIQHTRLLGESNRRDSVNVVNHKTRAFSQRVGARKREIPAWML